MYKLIHTLSDGERIVIRYNSIEEARAGFRYNCVVAGIALEQRDISRVIVGIVLEAEVNKGESYTLEAWSA